MRSDVTNSAEPSAYGRVGADAASVAVRVLGQVEVEIGGCTTRLAGGREARVLAFLAVNAGSLVPLDRLVDVLWDSPPESARQQIHNVVAALRRLLGGADSGIALLTHGVGYLLDAPRAAVDALRFLSDLDEAGHAETAGDDFEAMRLFESALGLWRGPAFAGLSGRHLESAAALLNEQRLDAVERLSALRLRHEHGGSLVAELTELVAEHPYREPLRARLMEALHKAGRQADALAVFDEGRRILTSELGLDPGPQLKSVHQRILGGDVPDSDGIAAKPPQRPGSDATPEQRRAPCFLPRDIPEFTGRTAEIAQSLGEVGQSGSSVPVIAAINGMGGIGKTTLAVHLAHQVAHDYPDGQYFIDLHGFSADIEPLTPLEALCRLLKDSGVRPEAIPADVEGCTALWRARLGGRSALLLLDNAIDAAHIRPLLPGSSKTLVIVTSRRRLTALDGAVSLALDTMPTDDAAGLFSRVIGDKRAAAEPEAVIDATELCGRLPLAIRIAAARLRDRRTWTVARLVSELRDHDRRARFLTVDDRSVMAALALSYRYLSDRQQRLFRLLSLHPGADFDACEAAAITGFTLIETADLLEDLYDDSLLLQQIPDRFQLHDFIRDCSLAMLKEHDDRDEQNEARRRILDYLRLQRPRTRAASLRTQRFSRSPMLGSCSQRTPHADPVDIQLGTSA